LVWDEQLKGVAGMIVAAERQPEVRAAFMNPTDVLVNAWSELRKRIIQPTPFMVEDLPEDFVDRPEEFKQLIELLLDEEGASVAITAALRGAGGYGKTTLARAICHDHCVRQAYPDGIVWVTLGEIPGDLTGQVEDLIQRISGERPGFADITAAASHLREALKDRKLLIVIDDVWNQSHLNPFIQGGPQCARLITTRNSDTLPHHAKRVDVDAMQQSQAVELLGAGLLPKISLTPQFNRHSHSSIHLHVSLRKLVNRLGEWPLLLKLVNGALRDRVLNLNQSLPKALDYVNKALDKRGLTAFDARNPLDRKQAVKKTLAVSFEHLRESEFGRYAELAIFPEDVEIPLVTIEKLWNKTDGLDDLETEELCARLFNLSLLLRFDLSTGTIRLHDVIRTYLSEELSKETLEEIHCQLLDAYALQNWTNLPQDEPYLWEQLTYHLFEAGRVEELQKLLFDFNWMSNKLTGTDVNALIMDYNFSQNDKNLRGVQGALRLSAHILALDKRELAGQLVGRLLSSQMPEISQLAEQIKKLKSFPWLCPLTPSLKPSGGAIVPAIVQNT
jgi:hypothetical protein